MPDDDELDSVFREILDNHAPKGWGGSRDADKDVITNGDRTWERDRDPNGPWTPVMRDYQAPQGGNNA